MEFKDIRTFIVGPDKIARPKNHNSRLMPVLCNGGGTAHAPNREWIVFEKEAQAPHYAVDESLTPGEYDASCFDESVWQYFFAKKKWLSLVNDPEMVEIFKSEHPDFEYRQFLPLKQQENKIDMSDVPQTPMKEYYSEQGKRMFDKAELESPKFGEWVDVEQLVDSDLFDMMQDAAMHQRYIGYPLENLLANGYDSQNVGKELRKLGVDDKACLWFHKLIFACEGLVKNNNFKKLEEKRVELVCAKYRNKKPSPPKSK